jgi:two-component system response regulator
MTESATDVLLIDDSPLDVELTLQAFKRSNLNQQVQVVTDGVQALDFLHRTGRFAKRPPDDPKLIILDLKLPLVDGHYVLRQIVSDPRTELIPVVVVSSSRESRDIYSTYKLGINSYVVKPVNSDTYIETIRTVATYWLTVNQAPTM